MNELNREIIIPNLSESLKLINNGIEITQRKSDWSELSSKYEMPIKEIELIDFNRSGVCLPGNEVKVGFRVRFVSLESDDKKNGTWFALPVRRQEDTNFLANNGELSFQDEVLAHIWPLMLDTCDTSYQRGPKLLNLNSRSRSNCGGCKACVHNYKDLYDGTVLKDQQKLVSKEDISDFFNKKEINGLKINELKQIAVVTGLFGSESAVVEHMKSVNEVVKQKGFKGELMYFGCEVNSEAALEELANLGNFSLIYARFSLTNACSSIKIIYIK